MGYGLGVFLLALGLVLAFAVTDALNGVDLTMVGYILVLAGLLIVALTAFQANRGRSATHVTRTTHADGRQTVTEQRNETDPPPTV
jgi:membrane protein implicated in regulation of membrane protease activity